MNHTRKVPAILVILTLLTGFAAATSHEFVQFTLTYPSDGESIAYGDKEVTFEYGVEAGPSGTVDVFIDGNLESSCTQSHPGSSSQTYTCTVDLDPGTHTWEVRFISDDSGDAYFSNFNEFTIQDANIDFTLTDPDDNENVGSEPQDVTFDWSISTDADITTELILDGNVIYTDTQSKDSSKNYQHTETGLNNGDYDWKVRTTYDDGTQESNTRTFTVSETTAPIVSNEKPNSGKNFTISATQDNTDVDFEWSVQSFEESGTTRLYLNNSQIDSGSFASSTTKLFTHTENLEPGYYEWYAEADTSSHTVQSSTDNFTITQSDLLLDVNLTSPDNDTSFTAFLDGNRNIDFEWAVNSEESGNATLYVDGTAVYEDSFAAFATTAMSHTEELSTGNHTWYVEADTPNGFVQTDTRHVEITEPEPFADIQQLKPEDGDSLPFGDGVVDFEYSVSGSHSGTVILRVNGTQKYEEEYNAGTTRLYTPSIQLQPGNYEWTVVVQTDEFTEQTSAKQFTLEERSGEGLLGPVIVTLIGNFEDWFGVSRTVASVGVGLFLALLLAALLTLQYAIIVRTGLGVVAVVNLIAWMTFFTTVGLIPGTFTFILILTAAGIVGYYGVKWVYSNG